jgi:hypothetical protein
MAIKNNAIHAMISRPNAIVLAKEIILEVYGIRNPPPWLVCFYAGLPCYLSGTKI